MLSSLIKLTFCDPIRPCQGLFLTSTLAKMQAHSHTSTWLLITDPEEPTFLSLKIPYASREVQILLGEMSCLALCWGFLTLNSYLLTTSFLSVFSCGLPLNWIPSLMLPTIFQCLNVIHLKAARLCRSQRSQKLPNNRCKANSIQHPNIGSEAQYCHVKVTEMNLKVSAQSKWRPVSIWLHIHK